MAFEIIPCYLLVQYNLSQFVIRIFVVMLSEYLNRCQFPMHINTYLDAINDCISIAYINIVLS